MTEYAIDHITQISDEELGILASRALGTDASPMGPPITMKIGRSGGVGTLGIYRVVGKAKTNAGEQQWSAVLKAIGEDQGSNPAKEVDPQREVAVYESGVFESVHGGLRSARSYGIQKRNGVDLVWLEDMSRAPHAPWVREYFIDTARNIGRFNGHWSESSLPDWPWLSKGGFRAKYRAEHQYKVFKDLPALGSHRLVRRACSQEVIRRLTRMWEEGEDLAAGVDAAPKGVCHMDCHPKNLFPLPDGPEGNCTVAIDWGSVGISSLGADAGILVASPVKWLEISPSEAATLVDPVLDAYLLGLHDTGWKGNEDLVRLTYLASLGMGEAVRVSSIISRAASSPEMISTLENLLGVPADDMFSRWSEAFLFYLDCADKAIQLSRRL